ATLTPSFTFAQAQAINAQIEGTVTDANGAAIPNTRITAVNVGTGVTRTATTDEDGFYRLPLLPLGAYKVTAEAQSFKKLTREGITLTTGQSATISMQLQPGGVNEEVTITSDAPIADTAKLDLGRVMNEREVHNLPLVSRNPYNFAVLQANVTGRPNSEFGVPRINANGYTRRTNYMLDGNNNTQADRAGIRLMPISEVMVSEVQLVTNGFAAEFGNTPGLIMNAVTPAGTNAYHGSASYRFRRTPFSARPFFFSGVNRPPAVVDNVNGAIGGPVIKDKLQFYTGYEYVKRDLSGESQRLINVTAANKAALVASGLPDAIFPAAIPTAQKVNFFVVRSDWQVNANNHLLGRYNLFRNNSPNNIAGGFNTLQRSIDFVDTSDSVGIQLISNISSNVLNEFRYQYARRKSQNVASANSGTGLTINITNVANFGAPTDDLIQPLETSNQFINNLTVTHGNHTMKFGAGYNRIYDLRQSRIFAQYTFPTLQAYLDAKSGANPRGYSNYVERFGNPEIDYRSNFYQFFAQDDWKVTPRLKINYGLRYDLYDVPQANPNAPLEFSRDFNVDKNNFAPRLGLVYGLRQGDRATVVRVSAGMYFEPPLLDIYRIALQNDGSPRFFNFTFVPTTAGAPAFPNTLGNLPAGTALPPQSPAAVALDYENLSAFHTNLQIEQALSANYSVTLGYIHSRGSHIPVHRNVNVINPTGTLADGRPIFSSTISAATRRLPQFNNIFLAESVGNSTYDAGVLQLNKRFSAGYQFSANYTWSHSIDDAPERNLVAATEFSQSDPTDRQRDRGNSFADQRHTFVLSFVGRPTFKIENRFLNSLVNDNQVGIILTANSGEVFNIVSNRDLNNDGITGSDRPLFIGRNTGRTPHQYNWDLRYSRFVRLSERFNVEVFGEFTNLWNRRSIFAVSGTVTTDAAGVLAAPLPDFITRAGANPTSLDSRQFQLGFKFNF
ncbi:MAG: TonB-dependent receptor, partial [Acidobacteriota bacterium]|nr:TonB-dependent receptor [Acidobacteriota bacterium]